MARQRTDSVSKDLALARKEMVKGMYFSMTPGERSLEKLSVIATKRFGAGCSIRTLNEWSRKEGWPRQAAEHDAARVKELERRVADSVPADQLDTLAALKSVLDRQLRILSVTASAQEERVRISIVETTLNLIRDLLDPKRRGGIGTQNNLAIIVDENGGGLAQRALENLMRGVHRVELDATPMIEHEHEPEIARERERPGAGPPARPVASSRASPPTPAPRSPVNLDQVEREAEARGVEFEVVLREHAGLDRPVPAPAPTPSPATAATPTFASLLAARRAREAEPVAVDHFSGLAPPAA